MFSKWKLHQTETAEEFDTLTKQQIWDNLNRPKPPKAPLWPAILFFGLVFLAVAVGNWLLP